MDPGSKPPDDDSSKDDIELDDWQHDLESRRDEYKSQQNGNGHLPPAEDSESSDDEGDDENDGRRALLTPREQTRTRGSERISLDPASLTGLWPNIKNIVIEAAPTLLLTTIGLLFTGELLDQVSHWRAMKEVDQLIMIIPVVLNLKGNLEMNLSARLGTAANMGDLDEPKRRRSIIIGNLTLLQLQATVVSFVAACVALLLGLILQQTMPSEEEGQTSALMMARRPRPTLPVAEKERDSGLATFIMLASTSMTAACLSSLVLGSFMCTLIVLCRKFNRDPDNIAPPVASCLGDLVTLVLVGLVSTVLIPFLHTPVTFLVCCLIVASATTCTVFVRRNEHVRDLVWRGWSPLFGAMVISSGTGIVLDLFVSRYEGFALLAVVISGLPGAVGAIFVSRLSTALHAMAAASASRAKSSDDSTANPKIVMATLMVITLPVEIIFLAILHGLGWLKLPFIFVAFSVLFFCCAVTASLFIARFLTNFLWRRNLDPDMYALPIHSALMDLIGQLLLVLCFEIVSLLGAKVQMKES